MRAVVLGGAGVMGSYVVEHLAATGTFDAVVAADADDSRRESLEAVDDAVAFASVDVTDADDLRSTLSGADVAVNCVGPFYRYAEPVLAAAVDAGVDVVDICDDYDVTGDLIDDYHDEAVDAGVTSVVGLGASPGVTNVLARRGADRLDAVDAIRVNVTRGAGEAAGGAIPYHVFHSWLGRVPTFRDGEYDTVRALASGEEVVEFPPPFGKQTVYDFGHPETVTLPRFVDGVRDVSCKGTLLPEAFRETLLQFESLGLTDEEPVTVDGRDVRPIDFAAAYLERLGDRFGDAHAESVPSGGAILVEVDGTVDDRPTTYRYAGTARMREATGAAASVGAQLVAEGQVDGPGVRPPEAVVPPTPFVERMADEPGFDLWEGVTEKRTRSGGSDG
ncbi:saccharopine dehydrogenase family protein [Halobacteriaceae archaeon GCM10025711]